MSRASPNDWGAHVQRVDTGNAEHGGDGTVEKLKKELRWDQADM